MAISGAGDYKGARLVSQDATVNVAGAGKVLVNAQKTLKATISGAGSVEYLGDPEVTRSVSGVGSVHREVGRWKRHHIAWVVRMYVQASAAGRGVGRSILRAAIEGARRMPGVSKVNLTVAASNAGAIALYTSEGFRVFATEEDAFRDPAPRTELSMSLRLDG